MVRRGGFLTWIVLAAVLLALLNLPLAASRAVKAGVREALAPLHALVSGAGLRARETVEVLRGLSGLAAENLALQAEMVRLRTELRSLQAAARENADLRALIGFRARAGGRLVAAEVIARDGTGWWQTVRFDRGRRDGLHPDLPVMTPDGLVGRIVEVSDHTSDALLISDPSCRVSVRLPRTGAMGVLRGTGVRMDGQIVCRLHFVQPRHVLRAGDEVVTSGLGGVFPPDIPVGHIESVLADATGVHRQADVLPRADLGSLRHVFVLMPPAADGLREDGPP